MTTDELVRLLEGLTDGLTLRDTVEFAEQLDLDDDVSAILIRFVTGERPVVPTLAPPVLTMEPPPQIAIPNPAAVIYPIDLGNGLIRTPDGQIIAADHESPRAGRHDGSPAPTEAQLRAAADVEREVQQDERRRRQERENPEKPLELGGKFSGVSLP